MHGKQRVIEGRVHVPLVHVGLRNPLSEGHLGLRPGQLPTHHHRHKPAEDQHDQAHEEELPTDHLMVGGKDVGTDKPQLFVDFVHGVGRHRSCFTHGTPLSWA